MRVSRNTIQRLGWEETLCYPPYSPDLAPSDCHLFHSLDNHIHGLNKPSDIKLDLEDFGYSFTSCNQLISKVNKNPLSFFPCNTFKKLNLPIFDLTRLGIRVEGYLILSRCKGIPPAVLSVPNSLNRNKEPPFFTTKPKNSIVKTPLKEFSSLMLSQATPPKINIPDVNNDSKEGQSQLQIIPNKDSNANDIKNLIDLFKIISNIVKQFPKLIEILPALKATNDYKQQAFLILESF
ncbi:uncharacterized protein TNCV_4169881 [Trichonephila clavipes]|nr:uncharacterized protein TNCV_4169881 [Trichonephila clavipes]